MAGGKKNYMRDNLYFKGDETDENLNNQTAPVGMPEVG